MTNNDASQPAPSAVPGLAVIGCFATGVAGIWFAFRHEQAMGLLAAAVAFGVVLHACFRR